MESDTDLQTPHQDPFTLYRRSESMTADSLDPKHTWRVSTAGDRPEGTCHSSVSTVLKLKGKFL